MATSSLQLIGRLTFFTNNGKVEAMAEQGSATLLSMKAILDLEVSVVTYSASATLTIRKSSSSYTPRC